MLDEYFPLVRLSRKKAKNKPWITPGIKASIKNCSELHKKYNARKTDTTRELAWKSYKHEITNCMRAAETQYYRGLLADHKNSCQNLWIFFGKILKKSKNKQKITKIKSDNENITNTT